jgi:hypothetical protein
MVRTILVTVERSFKKTKSTYRRKHAICQAARDLDVGSSLKIQALPAPAKTTTLAAIAESLAQR